MKRIQGLLFLVLFLVGGAGVLFGGGNKEIPEIPPVTSGKQYLSPNGDGIQDEATLDFSVKIYVKSKEGYVPEYGLQIKNPRGEVVREIVEKEKRDIGFFAALFSGYKEFTLQRSVRWEGLDPSGTPLPDGVYNLSIWVVDANGNRQDRQLDDFEIDTVPPSAKPVPPDTLVFNPNGNGYLDDFSITHVEATEEDLWEAEIRNASGTAVRSWSWEGVPRDILWEGKTDAGADAPAGIYRYVLESTDRAGNYSGEISIDNIELSRLETPVAILLDPQFISPDGDGVQDTLTVYFDREVSEGVQGWSWKVFDSEGRKVAGAEGAGEPPLELVYDGRNADGQVLREGEYTFFHSLRYWNGNRPETEETFVVDLTPPEITVSVETPVFSPNDDGRRDQARIRFTSNEPVTWEGAILNDRGEEILSTDSSQTTTLVVWDGMTEDGEAAPEGDYTVLASFTDRAGNITWSAPKMVRLDVSPVTLALSAPRAFSPDGDGNKDLLPIALDASQYEDVENWNLRIVDESGKPVQEYGAAGDLPDHVIWDGSVLEKANFAAAPDGHYRAEVKVNYMKGTVVEARSSRFLLDTELPNIEAVVTTSPFAETPEGVEGEVFMTVSASDNDRVEQWSMELLDDSGEVLRIYEGEGDPSDAITWNRQAQVQAPDPDLPMYSLRIRVADYAGNTSVLQKPIPLDILLVRKDGRYYLSVPNVIFGAYQDDLASAGSEMLARNRQTLDRVIGIYRRYPSYDLLLEGHALNIYRGTDREEREESILFPLTQRRSANVERALVDRGLEQDKIGTEAFGGRFPNAEIRDESLWWKVRRVEFVMLPPEESGP